MRAIRGGGGRGEGGLLINCWLNVFFDEKIRNIM